MKIAFPLIIRINQENSALKFNIKNKENCQLITDIMTYGIKRKAPWHVWEMSLQCNYSEAVEVDCWW